MFRLALPKSRYSPGIIVLSGLLTAAFASFVLLRLVMFQQWAFDHVAGATKIEALAVQRSLWTKAGRSQYELARELAR